MQPTLQQLAKELVECRGKLQEFEQRYRAECEPYEQAKAAIQEKLIEVMAKSETLSTRFEDFTISRKKSVKVIVQNDFAALASLKEVRPEYVIESIAPQALKEVEKGSLTLDGVTTEVREYVSIRQARADQN